MLVVACPNPPVTRSELYIISLSGFPSLLEPLSKLIIKFIGINRLLEGQIFRPAREVQDRRTLLLVDEQERERGSYVLKVDKFMLPIGIVLLFSTVLSGFDDI